ncbi:hypothetical protein ACC691_38095, partial [Rhizobium johnstonii]|uniref:hypothetical protein n=1 Tax=Rhizobium johnstonii TaxID=3019933 RepID=UPI003F9A1B35
MSNDTRRGWFGRRESDEPRNDEQETSRESVPEEAPSETFEAEVPAKPAYSDLDAEFRAAATEGDAPESSPDA